MEYPRQVTGPPGHTKARPYNYEDKRDLQEQIHESDNSDFEDLSEDEAEELLGAQVSLIGFPTDSQIAQARLLAAEQEATLGRIHAEYDRQISLLGGQIRIVSEALFKTKAFLAVIRRLPIEILGEIFVVHVRGNLQSPWTLMHVCKLWRNAALLTRAVWGAILLFPPVKSTKSRPRIINGKEVCMKDNHVRRALARAGLTPLDIQIRFNPKGRSSYPTVNGQLAWAAKQQNQIARLLECVTSRQEKTRIRSLDIDTNGSATFSNETFDRFDFRDLETLRLDSSYPELIKRAGKEAFYLRRLSIASLDLQNLAGLHWLNRLEELHIREKTYFPRPDTIANVTTIRNTLCTLTSLQSLIIEDVPLTITNFGARLDMPSLKQLKLNYNNGSFWPIECPNLTHLSIEYGRKLYAVEDPNAVHLPHLETLHYRTQSRLLYLDALSVPVLREFHFDGTESSKSWMRTGMQKIWNESNTPNINPIIFRLQAKVHQKVISEAIAAMSNVEEVWIEQTDITSEFFKELYPTEVLISDTNPKIKRAGKLTWKVGAPRMRRINLDLSGCKPKEGADAYEKAASELLAKRREAGAAMEKIEIRLTEEDGWMVIEE